MGVGERVGVAVRTGVTVAVGVGIAVDVGVPVGVSVKVGVGVTVGVRVTGDGGVGSSCVHAANSAAPMAIATSQRSPLLMVSIVVPVLRIASPGIP